MNNTLVSQRCHIAFFGCTNSGKSTLVNAIANQDVSLVSDIKGTTTDPVKKTMEILPLGAVVLFDTAGIDDKSELGKLRIEKTLRILDKTDVAILVVDITTGLTGYDSDLIEKFKKKNTPYIIVYNKSDLLNNVVDDEEKITVSAKTGKNIDKLKETIADFALKNKKEKYILKDLVNQNDIVVLVIPIDESAPKGRLILPQQNVLRELLDCNCRIICTQETELQDTLNMLNQKPKMVITDSQVFEKIKDIVPNEIYLTSFSILFARYKGILEVLVQGAYKISKLKDNDTILISEGCTHHRQCNDIGTVKFPRWLKDFTKKELNFEFTSGDEFKSDLKKYSLIIHCGGCMLNPQEMISRIKKAQEQNIDIVNYGMAIAYMNGILDRALKIFKGEMVF